MEENGGWRSINEISLVAKYDVAQKFGDIFSMLSIACVVCFSFSKTYFLVFLLCYVLNKPLFRIWEGFMFL